MAGNHLEPLALEDIPKQLAQVIVVGALEEVQGPAVSQVRAHFSYTRQGVSLSVMTRLNVADTPGKSLQSTSIGVFRLVSPMS